jgi:PAS domain-containing protein
MVSTASHETGRRPQEEAMLARVAQEEVGQGQQVVSVLHSSDLQVWRLLENLPAGAYICDADGLITYFNQHAVRLWGRAPQLHNPVDRFCGSFKLLLPDGSPIAHDQCWMALALKLGQAYNGHEIMIERPDGQRLTVCGDASCWPLMRGRPIVRLVRGGGGLYNAAPPQNLLTREIIPKVVSRGKFAIEPH